MEKSSFFNSVLDQNGNPDRSYLAEDYARYFASFIGNGVFPNPSNNLQAIANNMTITIKQGKAWINGYFYYNTDDLILSIDVADGVLDRIDRIVLRLDFINREIKVKVKKGTFASSPTAPALQRDADAYELALADVAINKGTISITQANITDLRLNKELCGIVHGVVDQVDITTLFNQYTVGFQQKEQQFEQEFQTWFSTIQGQLSGDVAGNLSNQINNLAGAGRTTETVKGNADAIAALSQSVETSLSDIAINVKALGAKGDGTTDDTLALQAIFDNFTNTTIFIPKGIYRITNTLYHDGNCSIILDDNAIIILDSETVIDYMFRYNSRKIYNNWDDLACRKRISGGKLDGNSKCKNIMEMSLYTNFTLEKVQFYNFLEKGLITRGQIEKPSGGLMGHELYFKNEVEHIGVIGVYNNGRDNKFYDITAVNCSTIIWTADGVFTKIHGWLSIPTLIPTSLFADIQESSALFNDCIIDTIRYGFRLAPTRKLRVNNAYFMQNETYYTMDYQANYPPVFFNGIDNTAIFYVKGMLATLSHGNVLVTSHYNKNHIFDDCIYGVSETIYDKSNYDEREYLPSFSRGSIATNYSNDCNNAIKNGAYEAISSNNNHPDSTSNGVIFTANAGLSSGGNPLYLVQIYIPGSTHQYMYKRARYWSSGTYTWFAWQRIPVA